MAKTKAKPRITKERVMLDERVQKLVEKLDAEYSVMRSRLNPVFTRTELQGIVILMTIMQLDEIDLRRLRDFVDSLKVRETPANGS